MIKSNGSHETAIAAASLPAADETPKGTGSDDTASQKRKLDDSAMREPMEDEERDRTADLDTLKQFSTKRRRLEKSQVIATENSQNSHLFEDEVRAELQKEEKNHEERLDAQRRLIKARRRVMGVM
jgi:hypothetical protein